MIAELPPKFDTTHARADMTSVLPTGTSCAKKGDRKIRAKLAEGVVDAFWKTFSARNRQFGNDS
jgi:hypothetical protein